MKPLDKKQAYLKGLCEHCSAFWNYDNKPELGGPAFMCGVLLDQGEKHLCTISATNPETIIRMEKEHKLKSGKHIEIARETFFNMKGQRLFCGDWVLKGGKDK